MKKTKKKIWSKPECTRIKLEPAEAVKSACKKTNNPTCSWMPEHTLSSYS